MQNEEAEYCVAAVVRLDAILVQVKHKNKVFSSPAGLRVMYMPLVGKLSAQLVRPLGLPTTSFGANLVATDALLCMRSAAERRRPREAGG